MNKTLPCILATVIKRLKFQVVVPVLLLFCQAVAAQPDGLPIDSIEKQLTNKKLSVSEQIKIYDDLSWHYQNTNMRKAVDYGFKGLKLAQQKRDKKMEATFYRNIGVAYYMGSVNDSARIFLDLAFEEAKSLNDKRLIALIHGAIGNLYRQTGHYNKAIENYLATLSYFENQPTSLQLGKCYSNIGGTYQLMTNFDQALKYFDKALIIAKQLNDEEGFGSIYVSMSDIYLLKGEDDAKALQYAKDAVTHYRRSGNQVGEVVAMLTVAKNYYNTKDSEHASAWANDALKLSSQLNFPDLLARSYIILSNISYNQGQYELTEKYALKVLEYDSINPNYLTNVYGNLIRSNAFMGRPDLSERYLDNYRKSMNHYSTEKYQQSLSEMEVKYETEKKALKITSLEKQRNLYLWLGAAGIAGLLLLLLFAWQRYKLAKSRQKLAEQEMKQSLQEKQLIAVQATLDGETAERGRLARDLHDGLGSMLSVVKFSLPEIKSGMMLEQDDVSRFQKALGLLDQSIQELRRVAHHMMPESLVRYGLKASLTDFCESVPNVEFHYFGSEERISQKLEVMIYRSIHELVNNALKHAEATVINVQLVQEADRISFTVQDNGKGFNPETVKKGMGLKNIQQRVETYKGKMNIYSTEQGTEVNVELELKEE